ncbi:MAG: TlpA family protein disulfide reductase [Deltaproteobacteria bacterium]|jgi:thiol-disulfide isomerase/thioredoxin|nr:TlpA family protein disulfide reductase [Deltaproteobacteria bacterium]
MKIRPSGISISASISFFFASLISIYFLLINVSPARSEVTVRPIEEADLDEMINQEQGALIVSFMAAWCAPCIDELPALNNLYRKYRDQGLNVIGISIDLEGAVAIQPVVSKLKIDFPVYWFGEKAIDRFNLTRIPLLLVVKQGRVVERIPGRRPEKYLDSKVKSLLGR